MRLQSLTVGLRIKHPQYGIGVVKSVSEHTAEIRFDDLQREIDPELSGITPAEPSLTVTGLERPLEQFVKDIVTDFVDKLGFEKPEATAPLLGARWHKGKLVVHPADATLQTKEVPLEVFFHKIVGVRNQLRVLEQKINSHPTLNDGEKVEMQQYITRCYGSLTTFNILFKEKEDQF
jgi:hypothetical protein